MKLKKLYKPPILFMLIMMWVYQDAGLLASTNKVSDEAQSRELIEVLEEIGEKYQVIFFL